MKTMNMLHPLRRHQVLLLCLLVTSTTMPTAFSYKPEVDRRAIAGVWKLSHKAMIIKNEDSNQPQQKFIPMYPMKEFTVYPKDKKKQQSLQQQQPQQPSSFSTSTTTLPEQQTKEEMLLMLKEDGSFQQYATEEDEIPDKLSFLNDSTNGKAVLERFLGKLQGQWDFVDGKLILAADRPKFTPNDIPQDTVLVGRVVATSGQSLQDNPVLLEQNTTASSQQETSAPTPKPAVDTHLSVPKGKVNVGKFTYPRNHPSFFDQPMFQPISKGSFELKQVLGSLNTHNAEKEQELVEKFRNKDFYNKKFLLTSHPLGERRRKGNVRWSIKYKKYVEDPPKKKSKKEEEEEKNRQVPIRVMEVMFFANNTFATVGGLGESVLRGKFEIVGHDRDQLWMQIWRFGFGRSVSGSVYSEGRMLSKEDEKTYWGKISFLGEEGEKNEAGESVAASNDVTADKNDRKLLQVNGSVLFGYGLEPLPVAKFIMKEVVDSGDDVGEDDDDDDDDEEERLEALFNNGKDDNGGDDNFDWTNAFQ